MVKIISNFHRLNICCISFQLSIVKHPLILEIMEMSPMWKPHMEVPQLILAYQIAMN